MHDIHQLLNRDFDHKVKVLNALTSGWNSMHKLFFKPRRLLWKKVFFWNLLIIGLMVVGYGFFAYTPL